MIKTMEQELIKRNGLLQHDCTIIDVTVRFLAQLPKIFISQRHNALRSISRFRNCIGRSGTNSTQVSQEYPP